MGSPPKNTTQEQRLPEWARNFAEGQFSTLMKDPSRTQQYDQLGGPQLSISSRDPLYNLGQSGISNRIRSGPNPYAQNARGMFNQGSRGAMQGLQGMMNEASGAYLGGNPFMSAALQRARGDIQSGFQEAVGGLNSQFAGAGNRDSSGNVAAYGRAAQQALADPLTELYGKAHMQNYETERARQSAAAGNLAGMSQNLMASAGGMRQLEHMDDQTLMELGLSRQQFDDMQNQQRLANSRAEFEYNQNIPMNFVQPIAALARGYGTGTTSAPGPWQTNPMGQVGGMMAGAGGLASGIGAIANL
jgi:uncharacterized protein YjiS (DUF1127 family)